MIEQYINDVGWVDGARTSVDAHDGKLVVNRAREGIRP
jgi:hypothetical protein